MLMSHISSTIELVCGGTRGGRWIYIIKYAKSWICVHVELNLHNQISVFGSTKRRLASAAYSQTFHGNLSHVYSIRAHRKTFFLSFSSFLIHIRASHTWRQLPAVEPSLSSHLKWRWWWKMNKEAQKNTHIATKYQHHSNRLKLRMFINEKFYMIKKSHKTWKSEREERKITRKSLWNNGWNLITFSFLSS